MTTEFKCPNCKHQFDRNATLKRHMETVECEKDKHKGMKLEKKSCEHCGKTGMRIDNLNVHIKKCKQNPVVIETNKNITEAKKNNIINHIAITKKDTPIQKHLALFDKNSLFTYHGYTDLKKLLEDEIPLMIKFNKKRLSEYLESTNYNLKKPKFLKLCRNNNQKSIKVFTDTKWEINDPEIIMNLIIIDEYEFLKKYEYMKKHELQKERIKSASDLLLDVHYDEFEALIKGTSVLPSNGPNANIKLASDIALNTYIDGIDTVIKDTLVFSSSKSYVEKCGSVPKNSREMEILLMSKLRGIGPKINPTIGKIEPLITTPINREPSAYEIINNVHSSQSKDTLIIIPQIEQRYDNNINEKIDSQTKYKRTVTYVDRARVIARQRFRCANSPQNKLEGLDNFKCPLWEKPEPDKGMFNDTGRDYDIDHISEFCLTHDDSLSNLQALCLHCHRMKTTTFASNRPTRKYKKISK